MSLRPGSVKMVLCLNTQRSLDTSKRLRSNSWLRLLMGCVLPNGLAAVFAAMSQSERLGS